ncbi:MAG: hypothetical protein R2741_03855 [Methanolobus sp.]
MRAWTSFLFAARYPSYVRKLILISSGPFEERYASGIMKTRLDRMNENELEEYLHVSSKISDPSVANKNHFFVRFGKLMSATDSFDFTPLKKQKGFITRLIKVSGMKQLPEKQRKTAANRLPD